MAKKKEENKNMFSEVTAYQQLPIGQVTEDSYIRFGGYCNTFRVLPDYWGMKPSYRRLIHAALQFPSGQAIHTNELVGKMSATHPHSLTGIDDVVRAFTKKGIRYDSNGKPYRGPSVFWGKGNFGQVFIDGEVSPAAANRYTSTRISDEYYKIIGPLWKEVPQVESPGGAMEPHHIPLPIPLCLKGSTKIYLADGRNISIKEITKEFGYGKNNYVLSCSPSGVFSVSKIIASMKTKETNIYTRVTLSNGEVIETTVDHLFMKSDGSYVEAQKLQEEDILMSGIISKDSFNNTFVNFQRVSQLSNEYNVNHGIYHDDPEMNYYYHIDTNLDNNNPDNITKVTSNNSLGSESLETSIQFEYFQRVFVTKVELIEDSELEEFYDITVDSENHNFLLSSGVVVHNCLISPESILGLGVGIRTTIPSFSPQSLYQAYIHNDPMFLESNIDLILDKKVSDLKGLWTKGSGNIVYSYHLTKIKSEDGKTEGVLFSGDTGMGTISFNKKINKWIEEGKVVVDNVSDQSGPKLLISRVPNSRGITIDDIAVECEKICRVSIKAELNITDGFSGFRVPLYNWLDYVYKDYLNLLSQVNQKKIKAVEFEILVQNSIPLVVDYIMTKNPGASNEEIEKALGLSPDVVSVVMSKPIGYLRKNKDTSERIKELNNRLKELKKFDPIKFTENIINSL